MDSRDTTRPLLKWKHILNGIVGDLDYRPTFVWLDTDGDSRSSYLFDGLYCYIFVFIANPAQSGPRLDLVMLSGGKFGGIRVWQYDYEIDTPEDSDEAVAALADLIFDVNNHNSQKVRDFCSQLNTVVSFLTFARNTYSGKSLWTKLPVISPVSASHLGQLHHD
jgi:hypothetical protein